MRVELVNTGTELLLGDTINTNAAWIGQRLAALGIQVTRQTIVPDGAVIRVAIAEARTAFGCGAGFRRAWAHE
jgi:nicotinamide-nucleotide amidase